MPILKTHTAIWLGLGVLLLDLIAYFLLGYDIVYRAIQIPILGIAVTAMAAWTPSAMSAIRRGGKSAADKITMAIWMSWSVLTIQRIYAFFVAMLTIDGERPMWLVASPISTMIGTLIVIAGSYSAFATVVDPMVARPDKGWTIISSIIGAFAAGALTTYALLYGLNF